MKEIKQTKFHIKKNDLVEVITGEEKGRRGRVLEIDREKARAVVEGVNLVKKHQRARSQTQPSGIITIPAPIHISNLALICPKCGKRTKIRREKIENKRVRICKKCGEIIE
jgi:large subunit ribosomal protein L24|uniref:Large ribosomal subunit protein uL24 n=1 Tax=candidate division WOR-3 bacterium TaxID=2052148 RepID=A0A7V3RGF9_UNCW3